MGDDEGALLDDVFSAMVYGTDNVLSAAYSHALVRCFPWCYFERSVPGEMARMSRGIPKNG